MIKDEVYSYAMIFNSIEFQNLNKRLNKFNPLKVLKSSQYEIRHSNVISWFLTPNENHNMGEYFLKGFIAKLLSKDDNVENAVKINLKIEQILNINSADIKIEREVQTDKKRYIDLLIVSEKNKFVFLIENKFKSGESENQLSDYLEYVKTKYVDFSIIPVFLTLHSVEASLDKYLNFNYNDVVEILKNYMLLYGNRIDEEVRFFIKSYIDIIEEETLGNSSDIELATKVYKEFADLMKIDFEKFNLDNKILKTINFIKNFGNTFMIQAFEKFEQEHKNVISQSNSTSKISSFVLNSFEVNDFKTMYNWWFNKPFVLWFERLSDQRLKLTLELGPIKYDDRINIINQFESNGMKISNQAKRTESKYTRLFSETVLIKDWTSSEELYRAMTTLYNNKDLQNKLIKIESLR